LDNIGTKLRDIYSQIDMCTCCSLGKYEKNNPPRLRYKAGSKPILIVSQNPGIRNDPECDHVWGGLDILFGHFPDLNLKGLLDNVWITNLVKCRTPKNARPRADEIKACQYWLEQEISVLNPKIIIGLGKPACTWLEGKGLLFDRFCHPRFVLQFRHKDIPKYIEELQKVILGYTC